jgi:iron(III) transport system substrate-binding protein
MKKQFLALLLTTLIATFALASNKILVYISGPEKMVSKVEQFFEEKHGDVIDVYHTGSGPLQQKVWTEMMAGSIQADIIWGAEPLMYYSLMDAGVLQEYYPEEYDKLYDELKLGDGQFTATGIRYGTMVINTTEVFADDFPNSWKDLKKETFESQIAMADASQSAMAFALFAALSEMDDGKELLESMGENGVFVTKMNMDAISVVQSGEKSVCIAPSDGAYRLMKSQKSMGMNPVLKLCWPEEGAILIQRPIALVKKSRTTQQQEIAELFMDFSISEACQKMSSQFGFETVRKDLDFVLFKDVQKMNVDWEKLWMNRDEILDLYSEWF